MNLEEATIERIKRTLKFSYGIVSYNQEIIGVDEGLRNQNLVLHDRRIISEIVSRNINKILLKHRTRENVGWLEGLFLHKSIFLYLTYASMCYRAGIPIATIFLCRTAMEAGLRERIAERIAEDCGIQVWEQMRRLTKKRLSELILMAEAKGIIDKGEINKFFVFHGRTKTTIPNPRQLLDKYIHADFERIAKFLQEMGVDTRVFTPKTPLEEKKIQAEISMDLIAVLVLMATTLVAERLYLTKTTQRVAKRASRGISVYAPRDTHKRKPSPTAMHTGGSAHHPY